MKKLYALLISVATIEIGIIVIFTCTGFRKQEFVAGEHYFVEESPVPSMIPSEPIEELMTIEPTLEPSSIPDKNQDIVMEDGVHIKAVEETVQAVSNVTIRKNYKVDATKLGMLAGGKTIVRVGICDNGWSQVQYEGSIAYIKTDYLEKAAETTSTPSATPTTKATKQPTSTKR